MEKVINDLVGYDNLKIVQVNDYFNFSLDSVLLANFATITDKTKKIIYLGTGNAPIPLILSTRTNNKIIGVELQKEIYDLAVETVSINKLENQIQKSSNTSSSNLQSSNCSLIISNKNKKDSFFSVLNNNNNGKNIYNPNNVLAKDLSSNTVINNNSNNNNHISSKLNKMLLDEDYSPIKGKSHFINNRFSKFSSIKLNGINVTNNDTKLDKSQPKNFKNKTLRPKDWVEKMSLDNKNIKNRENSFNENRETVAISDKPRTIRGKKNGCC